MSNEWIMIGTAPSVERTLERVKRIAPDAITITTNGGIRVEPLPAFYVLVDQVACEYYKSDARTAFWGGSYLVTLKRDPDALKRRGVDWFNEFVEIPREKSKPHRGGYGSFRFSGPFCLEYACNHGARTIHLVGFDGYRFQGDYVHADNPGRIGPKDPKTEGLLRTKDILEPACNDIARAWSNVQFVQYGEPVFEVDADNWRVEQC